MLAKQESMRAQDPPLSPFVETVPQVIARANEYLCRSRHLYEPGDDRFFAQLALAQAVRALEDKNYGIGAVAVKVTQDEVQVFCGRNALVTGSSELRGVLGENADPLTALVGHAEAVSVLRSRLGGDPDLVFPLDLNEKLRSMPLGITVFGTLEPCPLCTCIMTNDRSIVRSVSTVLDPIGAYSINGRQGRQPDVWTQIQNQRGFRFELLCWADAELKSLSEQVFLLTREEIDAQLARADNRAGAGNLTRVK